MCRDVKTGFFDSLKLQDMKELFDLSKKVIRCSTFNYIETGKWEK